MGKFNVSPAKEKALTEKMDDLKIYEKDLLETFVKSGGKGGQNVNKNSTCVNIKHLPTGITVKYDKERSQLLNRFFARRELVNRFEQIEYGTSSPLQKKNEKIKKQKARRKRKTQNKIDTKKAELK